MRYFSASGWQITAHVCWCRFHPHHKKWVWKVPLINSFYIKQISNYPLIGGNKSNKYTKIIIHYILLSTNPFDMFCHFFHPLFLIPRFFFCVFGMVQRNLFSRHLIGRLPPFHLWVSGLVFLRGLFSISQEPWWWWMMGAGTLVFSISPSGSHLSRISHKKI